MEHAHRAGGVAHQEDALAANPRTPLVWLERTVTNADNQAAFGADGVNAALGVLSGPFAGNADVVSLHVAANPQTAGMVDAGFLSTMRDGATLINTTYAGDDAATGGGIYAADSSSLDTRTCDD